MPTHQPLHALYHHVQKHLQWIVGGAAIFFAIALLWLVLTPSAYTARMVLAPTPRGVIATRAVPADEAWGRRELVDLVQRGESESLSDFSRFLHLMTSQSVAEKVLEKSDLKTLFPEKFWKDPYALSAFFQKKVRVKVLNGTAMRHVSFRHPQRDAALATLNALYRATDDVLRQQARQRAQAQIDYLRQRMASLPSLDHRMIVARQLTEQENALMMVSVDLPFAADLLDPPSAGHQTDWPKTWALLLACIVLGGVTGLFAASLYDAWVREKMDAT